MKLIIAGSRSLQISNSELDDLIGNRFNMLPNDDWTDIEEIVSGGAGGIDTCAESFADCWALKFNKFTPDYDTYAGRAPLVRNSKMAAFADALLLIWDGKSNGSKDMKTKMLELKKPVYEVIIRSYNEPLHDN